MTHLSGMVLESVKGMSTCFYLIQMRLTAFQAAVYPSRAREDKRFWFRLTWKTLDTLSLNYIEFFIRCASMQAMAFVFPQVGVVGSFTKFV